MLHRISVAVACLVLLSPSSAYSQTAPALSSRPGAAYTIYLNFEGFSFNGSWADGNSAPGTTPAYNTEGVSSSFTANELANIRNIWSRTAEAYAVFNINVTTVDPAPANSTNSQRQAFYDAAARRMHTVIGGTGSWYRSTTQGVVGVSFLDVADGIYANNGAHTNWVFAQHPFIPQSVNSTHAKDVGIITIHENGHAFKLDHISGLSGGTGPGSRGAIMTPSVITAERALWAVGTVTGTSSMIQNDVALLQSNDGIQVQSTSTGFIDSGIGHTPATATVLPMIGNTINFDLAKGIITPISSSNPNPQGESNYTTDFFRFDVPAGGGTLNVTLNSGRSTITPGVADPGAMLNATLRLLAANGTSVLATSSSGIFTENINQFLNDGTYFLQISSAADSASFFEMGSYFLTGTFTPVPEPAAMLAISLLAIGGARVLRPRSRQNFTADAPGLAV